MTSAATSATPKPLIFARQIAGMAILALANPLVWYSNEPVLRWLESWCVPVLIALAAFGLYALFFTKRAKQAWPGRFFMLAWVLVVLATAGPWISLSKRGTAWEKGAMQRPSSGAMPTQSQPTPQTNPFSDPDYGKDLVR